jgi:hypothetical protein
MEGISDQESSSTWKVEENNGRSVLKSPTATYVGLPELQTLSTLQSMIAEHD